MTSHRIPRSAVVLATRLIVLRAWSNSIPAETKPVIHLTIDDYRRHRTLAVAMPRNGTPSLLDELDRATVVEPSLLPSSVITVNSRVRFQDTTSSEIEEYVLAWPGRADGGVERISVLAPIGTGLIGYRVGDELSWPTPGGTRRLKILAVEKVAEEFNSSGEGDALAPFLYGDA